MNKTEAIQKVVAARYPCQELPRGALTAIADELGCTRELVRQVAGKMGYGTNLPNQGAVVLCSECGEPLSASAARKAIEGTGGWGYHTRCAPKIESECEWCGKRLLTPVFYVTSRMSAPSQAGRYHTAVRRFCSRKCPSGPGAFGDGMAEGTPAKLANETPQFVDALRAILYPQGFKIHLEARPDGKYATKVKR